MTGNKTILSKYDDAIKEEVGSRSKVLLANGLKILIAFFLSCLFVMPDVIHCDLFSQALELSTDL
jgi:hypothetical protein